MTGDEISRQNHLDGRGVTIAPSCGGKTHE